METTHPKVSCLCPTFGRAHLLPEAVESFLRQDYPGEKELIVLNDFARQRFHFDHPEVRVVNVAERYATLGEKRNAAAALATGDWLMTWGDDDIHLPHRIRRLMEVADEHRLRMLLEGWHYYYDGERARVNPGPTTGAHLIAASLYREAGGIPSMNNGEDGEFNHRVKALLEVATLPYVAGDPAFIYRWGGTDRAHLSAMGAPGDAADAGYAKMAVLAEKLIAEGREPEGEIEIVPQWSRNWVGRVMATLAAWEVSEEGRKALAHRGRGLRWMDRGAPSALKSADPPPPPIPMRRRHE